MNKAVKTHGRYDDEELKRIINNLNPHVIWFPAQCYETYSYTLSAALRSGRPLVVPNIGAFPERVDARPCTWIEPWNKDVDAWVVVGVPRKPTSSL